MSKTMPDKTPQDPRMAIYRDHLCIVTEDLGDGEYNLEAIADLSGNGYMHCDHAKYEFFSVRPTEWVTAPEALSNGASLEVDKSTAANHPPDKHQRELDEIINDYELDDTGDALDNAIDKLQSLIARTNRESRIDEVMRWMPISPDPHNSWDMRFVEAGKRRIAELESQQESSNE